MNATETTSSVDFLISSEGYIFMVILFIIVSFGIPGNTLCLLVTLNKKYKKVLSYVYLASIASADLIGTGITFSIGLSVIIKKFPNFASSSNLLNAHCRYSVSFAQL